MRGGEDEDEAGVEDGMSPDVVAELKRRVADLHAENKALRQGVMEFPLAPSPQGPHEEKGGHGGSTARSARSISLLDARSVCRMEKQGNFQGWARIIQSAVACKLDHSCSVVAIFHHIQKYLASRRSRLV